MRWNNHSAAERPRRRPLLLAQELGRGPDDDQIIIRPGMLPMRVRKMRGYADSDLRSKNGSCNKTHVAAIPTRIVLDVAGRSYDSFGRPHCDRALIGLSLSNAPAWAST